MRCRRVFINNSLKRVKQKLLHSFVIKVLEVDIVKYLMMLMLIRGKNHFILGTTNLIVVIYINNVCLSQAAAGLKPPNILVP